MGPGGRCERGKRGRQEAPPWLPQARQEWERDSAAAAGRLRNVQLCVRPLGRAPAAGTELEVRRVGLDDGR